MSYEVGRVHFSDGFRVIVERPSREIRGVDAVFLDTDDRGDSVTVMHRELAMYDSVFLNADRETEVFEPRHGVRVRLTGDELERLIEALQKARHYEARE